MPPEFVISLERGRKGWRINDKLYKGIPEGAVGHNGPLTAPG